MTRHLRLTALFLASSVFLGATSAFGASAGGRAPAHPTSGADDPRRSPVSSYRHAATSPLVPLSASEAAVEYSSSPGPGPISPSTASSLASGGGGYVRRPNAGPQSAPLAISFPTLTVDFSGVDARLPVAWPAPDPDIAAGPSSLVLVTNDLIALHAKSGELLAEQDLRDFFSGLIVPGQNGYDPVVIFDPLSERFFIVATGFVADPSCTPGSCVSDIFLGVSKSSSPAGFASEDWYFYDLDATLDGSTPTANVADAPKVGANIDTVVLTSSMYRFSDDAWVYEKIRILDKSNLVAGEPATWTDFWGMSVNDELHATFQPALHFDAGTDTFFLLSHGGSAFTGSCETVWGINDPLGSPALQAVEFPDGGLQCIPHLYAEQKGGGVPIWMGNNALHFRAVHRNGSLWTTRMLGHDFGGGDTGAIRWFQANVSDWPTSVTRVQDAIFGIDGIDHFFPTLMVDEWNNVVLLYARSSPGEYASLYFTGRWAHDPPSTLRPGTLLRSGEANIALFDNGGTVNRYGDYFGVALDPTDGSFWLHGEYAKASDQWGTWVGNVIIDQSFLYLPLVSR